jgi:hypothetical protein
MRNPYATPGHQRNPLFREDSRKTFLEIRDKFTSLLNFKKLVVAPIYAILEIGNKSSARN